MVPPATAVAATRSASDSNFRSGKGEWFRLLRPWRQRGPLPILIFVAAAENSFACSSRCGNALPRLILIIVAAKENGFACSGRGGYDVHIRFYSPLPRKRMVSPADRHFPTAASILDFRLKLANHCKVFPV